MNTRPILLGITGNIASGKSTVRQYLENEGALTIDADLLAQSTYLPGGPAYQPILDTFGNDLCLGDGQINRSRLGRIVFADPAAMQKLEAIIHPLVTEQILEITARAEVGLVVVEAIKLFEAGIHEKCDAVWTVAADENVRKERLMDTRGLTEADALRRIRSQSPEEEKIRRSDYVIFTDKNFRSTYEQTMQGLATLNQDLPEEVLSFTGEVFRPLRPGDFNTSYELFSRVFLQEWRDEDLFRALSRQTVLAGFNEDKITALAFWKAELFLSLIQNIIPYAPQSEEVKHTLEVLAIIAHTHLCQTLYISRELIHPATAKALGYLPGDYFPPELNTFAVTNFLRKYGLMPEEVFFKPNF